MVHAQSEYDRSDEQAGKDHQGKNSNTAHVRFLSCDLQFLEADSVPLTARLSGRALRRGWYETIRRRGFWAQHKESSGRKDNESHQDQEQYPAGVLTARIGAEFALRFGEHGFLMHALRPAAERVFMGSNPIWSLFAERRRHARASAVSPQVELVW